MMEKVIDTILINVAMTNILFILEEKEALSIKELAKKSRISSDTASMYVSNLEDCGFVERFVVRKSNGKGVRLSSDGRKLIEATLSLVRLEQELINKKLVVNS